MSIARSTYFRAYLTVCVLILTGGGVSQVYGQPQGGGEIEHHAKLEVKIASKQSLGKGVTQAALTNGTVVLVQENHTAPVATVRCFIKNTGSAYEGKYLGAGLSHLLEHLVAGGTTTKRTEKEVNDLMDSLGGQTNAYTSDEVTAFFIDCPSKGVLQALELIAENMQFSTIPEAEFKREMGVVQRELEMGEADRRRVLYNKMKQLIFQQHPVRHPTIGYISVVQQVKREEVLDFYHDRYVPQNLVFVITGDVKTEEILSELVKHLKGFHRTTERGVTLQEESEQASPRNLTMEMEGATTDLSVAWPTVPLQHPDLYPLDVASYILTNGDSSRLVKRLRIDRPLVTSVDSASYTPGFVKGWFQVHTSSDPANVQVVSELVWEELERLKTEPVSEAELNRAKRQKSADHVFGQQTVQNQAEMLANSYLATGDALFDDRYVEGIQKVTAEEIQAVARKYFVPERKSTVMIRPLGSGESEKSEGGSQLAESEMVKKVLPNGLTVLLKRQAAVPMVSIQAYAKAGVVSDSEAKSGRAALAADVMVRGTKRFSGDEIAEHFDDIGGSLAMTSQRNSTYLQCSVLKEDFISSLDYVEQVLFAPTFPEEEFEKLKAIQLTRIKSRQANPQAEILDFWATKVPASSPYHLTVAGTVESVSKLTAADCREFHQMFFVPSNMVLAIVGDIDVDATAAKVQGLFGEVAAGHAVNWPQYQENSPLAQGAAYHLKNQKANTAMVTIGYPIHSLFDEKQRSTLEMFEGVLTGGNGAGGRLHDELRGERLVYYVFGQPLNGFVPGYFIFMAQTRPDTLQEVLTRIETNLKKIRDEGVPKEEFEKTRQMLIAGNALRDTTAGQQAQQAALDELYGLGFDYSKKYEERLNAVTQEDVQALAKEFFVNGIQATSSPEEGPTAEKK
ncbi:MAG: insulinase family protein [Planctomycetaceae bacterium]|nr:insulinase family protein [Planctomycetaceae bacterium]